MQEILKELGVRVVEHHQDRDELAVTRSHEHLAVPTDSKTTVSDLSANFTVVVVVIRGIISFGIKFDDFTFKVRRTLRIAIRESRIVVQISFVFGF